MKVLIIQQKMIGDVLTSTILFEMLKKHAPKTELHYLVNSNTIPVIENNPVIDKIIAFTPEIEASKSEFKKLREQIKAEKYDIVIDAYAKISSAWIAKTSKAKYRISYKKWYTSVAYSHTYKRKKMSVTAAGLAIENRLLLLSPILGSKYTPLKPKIYLTETEKEEALKLLTAHKVPVNEPLYMISILGSDTYKTYPLPYLAALLDYLVAIKNCSLIFNYIPSQKEEVAKLLALCKAETKDAIYPDVYGKSLRAFIALASHCDAVIGNEGGAINMAKAIDIPTFAIFCPWINKGDWAIFNDGKKHASVHLYDYVDYHPRFSNKKSAKIEGAAHFDKFKPSYIIPELHKFVTGESVYKDEEKFSATVITFNEEKNIARCIESLLPVADDIVILDSISTDRTKEICQQYPVRFLEQPFEGHIQQKNAAIDLAKYNRVISLDADEALSKELQYNILRLRNNWQHDGHYAQRYNNYCGQWIEHTSWNPDRKIRVFDRRKARWGGINPHDTIILEDDTRKKLLKGSILHWVHRTYTENSIKAHKFSSIAAKEYFRLGRSSNPFKIVFRSFWTFFKGYIIRLGILDGFNGYVICAFDGYTTFLKYLKLYQMIQDKKITDSKK